MKFDNNNTADYTITVVNYVDKNASKENFENSRTYALATFSGYLAFTSGLLDYGIKIANSAASTTPYGKIFSVVDGVINGVFDKNGNPDKSMEDVIGTVITSYLTSAALGATTGIFLGPIGSIVGATAGAIIGGFYGSDVFKFFKHKFLTIIDISKSIEKEGAINPNDLSFEAALDLFSILNLPHSWSNNDKYKSLSNYEDSKQTLLEFQKSLNDFDIVIFEPFCKKINYMLSKSFSLNNIYVVSISSDGTNNISKINKALKKREENSEFKAGNKEEILLICPYYSAQIIAPYQPKNTKLTIILADKTYLDCINLNPQGSKDESKLMLTNYKFNPYEANSKEEDIKFVDSATSGDVTLYKDSNNKFISQDKKYSYDGSKVTLNFFNNLNFNLLNFAKENGFSLRSDKSSAMFDVRLKLADKEESKPTTNNGNCNLIVKNLIITDENLNSSDIKEIYLHNCEDKRVYRSCSLEKNDNEEADKNSYTAKFNINLILDKDQSVFKRTTKFILAYRDLSKDYSTSDIHSMSDNGVISLEAKKKAEGSITYDLKTSLVDIANNITNVTIENTGKLNVKEAIKLKAMYKPNKGDDNYKDINWAYEIIRQDEYNKEIKDNNPIGYIVLEGDKFKGKEISFTPQNDIKDKELLEKLKENNSTIVFFAYLRSPSYKTRYGKTHIRADFRVPMELKYENNKLYIYEFGHTDKSLSFDASLSNAFINEINDTKKTDNAKGRYYISSNINSESISIYKDHKLKELAYCSINDRNRPARALLEIYASGNNTKSSISNFQNGINLINSENKSKFISKFNEVKQRVKLENTQSVSLEVIEEDNEIIFPLKVKPLNDKDGVHSRYYWASAPGAHQASLAVAEAVAREGTRVGIYIL